MVKNATTQFPMKYLQNLELSGNGYYKVLASFNDDRVAELLAFLWVYLERRYVLGNSEGITKGETQYRSHWRHKNDDDDPFAEPEKQWLEIPKPKMVETYHSVASKIDCHNKQQQNDVKLEQYVRTH